MSDCPAWFVAECDLYAKLLGINDFILYQVFLKKKIFKKIKNN
jgi:hypothetical protein